MRSAHPSERSEPVDENESIVWIPPEPPEVGDGWSLRALSAIHYVQSLRATPTPIDTVRAELLRLTDPHAGEILGTMRACRWLVFADQSGRRFELRYGLENRA